MNNSEIFNKNILKEVNSLHSLIKECIRQMHLDEFKPDLILGVNDSSMIISILMSKYFECNFFLVDLDNLELVDNNPKTNFYSQFLYENIISNKKILVILNENKIDISYKKFNLLLKYLEDKYCCNNIPKYDIKYASIIEYADTKSNINYYGGINNEKIYLFFDFWWLV